MIELYNALKFIIMLFFIRKILTFYLGVACLKSVSIVSFDKCNLPHAFMGIYCADLTILL